MNTTTWTLDPNHTLVEFSVKHMMFTTVRGRFQQFEGTIHLDEDNLSRSSVSVTIDPSSIFTGVSERDKHLRSADFLDVARHPQLTFRSTGVSGLFRPGADFEVGGDLTIAGVTREVTLDASFQATWPDPDGDRRSGFAATTVIDRRDFGLTWNQALEAGGVLVGHEVKIALEVQAVQLQPAAVVG